MARASVTGASGYFSDSSMVRRVHREQIVALSGPRALLMQAAHPVTFIGFFATTSALADPYPRLERTAAALNTIIFGEREQADLVTSRVRRVHGRMRGRLAAGVGRFPVGTRWAADDPRLLLWIVATLVDSALLVYQRYVGALSREQRQRYWDDYKVIARLFGIPGRDLPPEVEDLRAYVDGMLASDELFVIPEARELATRIVLCPPVPVAARPALELANFITIGLLPGGLRRQYGLRWDPVRALVHRGGMQYSRRLLIPLLPDRLRYRRAPALAVR